MNPDFTLIGYWAAAISLLPVLLVFLVLQFAFLQGANRRRSQPLRTVGVFGRASVGVIAGSAVGIAVWFAVFLLGPPYALGDFKSLGLTMLLAFPVAGIVALMVSHLLSRRLVVRAAP